MVALVAFKHQSNDLLIDFAQINACNHLVSLLVRSIPSKGTISFYEFLQQHLYYFTWQVIQRNVNLLFFWGINTYRGKRSREQCFI